MQILENTRWHEVEGFENIKGVIKIRISKDRQHNGQRKKNNQRSAKQSYKTNDRGITRRLRKGKKFLLH